MLVIKSNNLNIVMKSFETTISLNKISNGKGEDNMKCHKTFLSKSSN